MQNNRRTFLRRSAATVRHIDFSDGSLRDAAHHACYERLSMRPPNQSYGWSHGDSMHPCDACHYSTFVSNVFKPMFRAHYAPQIFSSRSFCVRTGTPVPRVVPLKNANARKQRRKRTQDKKIEGKIISDAAQKRTVRPTVHATAQSELWVVARRQHAVVRRLAFANLLFSYVFTTFFLRRPLKTFSTRSFCVPTGTPVERVVPVKARER